MVSVRPPTSGWRRYEISLLCAAATVLCYADRTNIGIAIPAFQPDHAVQGQILSAFFYGYIATQLIGAYVATVFGPKRVLMIGVLTWTIFDLLTVPFATSPVLLWIARVGMGFGEGVVFPCLYNIAASWYPQPERSRLNATVSGGMDLGTIVAMVMSPLLMAQFGYAAIFYTFGSLTSLWILLFLWRGSDSPETDALIESDECDYIVVYRRDETKSPSATELQYTTWPIIAIYVSHFCYNYGWYVLLSWIPQYFRLQLNLELASSGIAAAVPYICGYLGVITWGFLSDWLIGRGLRVLTVRQIMNGIGMVGAAIALYCLRFVASAPAAVALLSMTLFLSRAATSGYWVNMLDVAPRHAGHLMAVSNTISTVPGIFGNIVTGAILEKSGDWNMVFSIVTAILVCGGFFFQLCASDESQEKPKRTLDDKTPLLAK
ncbi:hypothetical protein AeRB84_021422 [Aphanomyces euteiches]|nr:hypothetical protein AeRB84_021422 [Aphanomyces euteiches]